METGAVSKAQGKSQCLATRNPRVSAPLQGARMTAVVTVTARVVVARLHGVEGETHT